MNAADLVLANGRIAMQDDRGDQSAEATGPGLANCVTEMRAFRLAVVTICNYASLTPFS